MADNLSFNTDGTITFDYGDLHRVLKRPSLRQYRNLLESLSRMRDEALARSGGDLEDESKVNMGVISYQLDALVAWFDEMFESLSGERLPRRDDGSINDDLLPSWLLSGGVINDVVSHWQTVPSRHGGR